MEHITINGVSHAFPTSENDSWKFFCCDTYEEARSLAEYLGSRAEIGENSRGWFVRLRKSSSLEEHPLKNYYVSMEEGGGIVIYTYDLTPEEITKFVNIAAAPNKVTDIAPVEQEMLQYYYIDGRVWMDTPDKVAKVRAKIA